MVLHTEEPRLVDNGGAISLDAGPSYFIAKFDEDDKRELVELIRVVVQDELKRADLLK